MFYQSGAQDLSLKDKMQFKVELQRMMQQHSNSPRCTLLLVPRHIFAWLPLLRHALRMVLACSIVAWVIFNEGEPRVLRLAIASAPCALCIGEPLVVSDLYVMIVAVRSQAGGSTTLLKSSSSLRTWTPHES